MNNLKISVVLLGPSSERFKGGIAQFTHHLADCLAKVCKLHFFSWYQQYPPLLISRNFCDDVSTTKTGRNKARFILGYMNPLSWIRFINETRILKPNVICVTWIHPVHAPIFMVLNFFLKLLTNAEIVYLCHNVLPHETFPGSHFLTRMCLSKADRLVVHGKSELEKARILFPKKRVTLLYLPLFNFFQSSKASKPQRKQNRYCKKILFFGHIRKYKGLDILIEAFAMALKRDPQLTLKIAGEMFYDKEEDCNPLSLIEKLNLRESVTADIRYIPNEEIPEIFHDVDLAVFPYRSASQSGPLTVAYSYGVPVIATKVGGLPDVVMEGESGFLVEPERPDLLAEAIIKFFDNPIKSSQVKAFASRLSWENYVNGLLFDKTSDVASVVHSASTDRIALR